MIEVLAVDLPADPLEALVALENADHELHALRAMVVEKAREAGASWQEIGEALGITRQAAQQHYGRN